MLYSYDNKGRVTRQSQGLNQITYSYDNKGNIQTITDAKGLITRYEYDMLGRVVTTTYPNNKTLLLNNRTPSKMK
ncbi:MAG: RHS repeat protein [Campylobacteraceae bacterium]|nr:RHS repeat protein [Campylobacteraceae bacterium]